MNVSTPSVTILPRHESYSKLLQDSRLESFWVTQLPHHRLARVSIEVVNDAQRINSKSIGNSARGCHWAAYPKTALK
jgi:hypothetical protein